MKQSAKFYQETLYPFQDGILNIVKKLSTPFYLTGGTALSRHYFNHRFSDDLSLFETFEFVISRSPAEAGR
ncbi:MAG: nucleotidyl transferase AbiEii/AbiGii toxin family protein [Deltaproteobacteria bacterium]|nr:nucleotidyl transferase AbiEii/AbiGii toxin family protein [Deltaproteobacteria bacterium]